MTDVSDCSDSDKKSWVDIDQLSESLVSVCLAGVGGALVGLSFRHTRRLHPVSSDSSSLPYIYAIRFTAFVGVLEFHQLISPSTIISNLYSARDSEIPAHTAKWISIVDYCIGGATAGFLFSRFPTLISESKIDSVSRETEKIPLGTAKQKRLIGRGRVLYTPHTKTLIETPPSSVRNTVIHGSAEAHYPSFRFGQALVRGAIPGLLLGCVAGVIKYSLENLLNSLQEKQKEQEEEDAILVLDQDKNNMIQAEKNVKDMTIDELKNEIQALKLQRP